MIWSFRASMPYLTNFVLIIKNRNGNINFVLTEIKDFVIIPIHTPPEAAVKEIDELYDVYQNVSEHWQSQVKNINAGTLYDAFLYTSQCP